MHDSDQLPNTYGPFDYELFDPAILDHYTVDEVLAMEHGRIRRLPEFTDVLHTPALLYEAQEHFTGTQDEIVRSYVTRRNEVRVTRINQGVTVPLKDLQYAAEFYGIRSRPVGADDIALGFTRWALFMSAIENEEDVRQ